MSSARVLLIVPTLGKRLVFLRETLTSIRSQQVPTDIVVVVPNAAIEARAIAAEFEAHIVDDPGSLPAAINLGVSSALADHAFVNWLNDDDLLEVNSLHSTISALERNPTAVVAFGACRYIDPKGHQIWVSNAGSFAPWILTWGPDLIPQPGMLIRAEAWRAVGGLDESYQFAFDLDLLLRLRKMGSFISVKEVVSSFRWHPDSLTVSDRRTNIMESERAKRASLSPALRPFAWFWEYPVRAATHLAARAVQWRAQRAVSRN